MPQVGKYRAVADHYREKIERGEYEDGSRFESIPSIAEKWNINKNTALRAVQELQRSGHLRSEYGGGTYVQWPAVKPD